MDGTSPVSGNDGGDDDGDDDGDDNRDDEGKMMILLIFMIGKISGGKLLLILLSHRNRMMH